MQKRNKIKVYQIIAVVLCIVSAVAISSFANSPEVTERSIVTMMGVDSHQHGVTVSAHMLVGVPGIAEQEFRQDMVLATGRNLHEAMHKFNARKGRKVEFGQCGLVVFGAEISESGILEDAKNLFSARVVSGGILVLTTQGSAADFLENAANLGEQTSENITKFLTKFQNTLEMPMAVLLSYLNGELGESGASVVPIVSFGDTMQAADDEKEALADTDKYEKTEEESEESKQEDDAHSDIVAAENIEEADRADDEGEEEAQAGEAEEEEGDQEELEHVDIVSLNTAAVFKGGKRVGYLTAQQTRGYNFTRPESKRGAYLLEDVTIKDETLGAIFSEVRSKNVRTRTSFIEGKPKIAYTLNMRVEVVDTHQLVSLLGSGTHTRTDIYTAIEEAFALQVTQDIHAGLQAQQTLNADIFGLQHRFWRTQHHRMAEYTQNPASDFLQDVEVEINVRVQAV